MITATGTRQKARTALTGKWGTGVLITLCYSIIELGFSALRGIGENNASLKIFISLILFLISIPISYGMIVSFIKLKRSEKVEAFDFLKIAFSDFSRIWSVAFNKILKMVVPVILLVISSILLAVFSQLAVIHEGYAVIIVPSTIIFFVSLIWVIVKSFSLVLAYYIAYDNPDMSASDCCAKSIECMKGNCGNYFVLALSFIGWAFLCAFTFGIGYLWLNTYISVSNVCFYEEVTGNTGSENVEQQINEQ